MSAQLIAIAILGIVFTVVCSYLKARWGYSKWEIMRDSPLGLGYDKWVANPARFLLLYCAVVGAGFALWKFGPSLMKGAADFSTIFQSSTFSQNDNNN